MFGNPQLQIHWGISCHRGGGGMRHYEQCQDCSTVPTWITQVPLGSSTLRPMLLKATADESEMFITGSGNEGADGEREGEEVGGGERGRPRDREETRCLGRRS